MWRRAVVAWGKEGEKKLYLFCVSWGGWSIDAANVKPLAQDQECYVYELIMNPCPMTHPFIFGQSCVCTYLIYFLHTTPARTRVTVIRESDRHEPGTRWFLSSLPGAQHAHRISTPAAERRRYREPESLGPSFSWRKFRLQLMLCQHDVSTPPWDHGMW